MESPPPAPPQQGGFQFSWKWAVPVGCAAILACLVCVGGVGYTVYTQSGDTLRDLGIDTEPDIIPEDATPVAADYALGDMTAFLSENGGTPCEDNKELTCVTIQVPLDHNDASNTKTLDIVFGVHPARVERQGMYVQAFPGGPGGEGISSSTLSLFSDEILDRFDIVFFDQRGIGISSPLTCDAALGIYFDDLSEDDTEGEEGLDTPEEETREVERANTFVADCTAEMGIPAEEYKFYGTDQVAEDIETFRALVGDDRFYLYGVSYGTAVAQMYAAAHPDRLAGLVLDGTIDLTLDAPTTEHNQEVAFEKVLAATFDACRSDVTCMQDFGGDDPQDVYDELAVKLSDAPIEYAFPLPDGTKARYPFTLGKLEAASAFMMYSTSSRMFYLRGLAAANRGDFVPLARLLYARLNYDPATEDYIGDPTFSYAAYFLVNCADDVYFDGTPEEKIAQVLQAGKASIGLDHPMDGNIYSGLACATWPSQPAQEVTQPPLTAPGVPTFVLNATLDPATPFEAGKAVAGRLEDGYHLFVEGGQHSIIGSDEGCPDDYITNFLVYGELPDQREIECRWADPLMWSYLLPVPADVNDFDELKQAMFQTEIDVYLLPEHLYNSKKEEEVSVGCPLGGSVTFVMHEDDTETFTFNNCSFSRGFIFTGDGDADLENGIRTYNWTISGDKTGELTYNFNSSVGISLTGTYGGEEIDQ